MLLVWIINKLLPEDCEIVLADVGLPCLLRSTTYLDIYVLMGCATKTFFQLLLIVISTLCVHFMIFHVLTKSKLDIALIQLHLFHNVTFLTVDALQKLQDIILSRFVSLKDDNKSSLDHHKVVY